MKKSRRKYIKPSHPWQGARIAEEDKLLHQFGLRRKREIWRAQTILRNFRRQARKLLPQTSTQADLETRQLLRRLQKLGLVGKTATLDDVLGLKVENILERYLQVIVHRKGLTKTPRQARQFILHGHVKVDGRKVDVPSYLVDTTEETLIEVELQLPSEQKGPAPAPEKPEEKLVGPEPPEVEAADIQQPEEKTAEGE
jgi:small subunit ribosomal protein S4